MLLLNVLTLNKKNENLLDMIARKLSCKFLLFLLRVNRCKVTLYYIKYSVIREEARYTCRIPETSNMDLLLSSRRFKCKHFTFMEITQ